MTPEPACKADAAGPRIAVQPLDPDALAVRELLELSDRFTLALYPGENIHLESAQELKHPDAFLAGIHIDGLLVACGAVRMQRDDGEYGEIKRVFVRDTHRGMGCATRIMDHLEQRLRSDGIGIARLVTGARQTGALQLYRSLGYRERGAFGAYRAGPASVFMEKPL